MTTRRLPWFRMYTESRNDSKLDALADREFRIWHKLLCYSAESEPRGVVDYSDPEFTALEIRVDADDLDAAIKRMTRVRLVEVEGQFVFFPSFAERQYDKPSDHPGPVRERKRKSRAAKSPSGGAGHTQSRGVTPLSRGVTHREEEIREETDKKDLGVLEPVDNSAAAWSM